MLATKKERDDLTAERDALRQALNEMSARAGALEEAMGLRQPGADGDRKEPSQAPSVSGEQPVQASAKKRASGFWDLVLKEVADLLGDRELAPKTIIAELSKDTNEKAAERDSAWSPLRLTHKMRQKAGKKELFEETKRGLFRRLPGDQAASPGDPG